MDNKFFILQSGFVTSSDDDTASLNSNVNLFKDYVLNKGYLKTNNEYLYSEKVKVLFDMYMADHKSLNVFDFREKILIEAFNSFKINSMFFWFRSQAMSPFLSSMHIEFLLDTLEYVDSGKRRMDISQWKNLLDTNSKKSSTDLNVDKFFNEDYSKPVGNDGLMRIGGLPGTMEDFIRSWVIKENGFEDLLISLYVIFGDRSAAKIGN